MPPRTHCSAAISCGGVRSKSSRGASSATLTEPHPLRCPDLCRPPPDPPSRLVTAAPSAPFYRMALTVFCEGESASNHAVHRTVDSLCRHAARAVRDLGVRLWTKPGLRAEIAAGQPKLSPPAVRRRKSASCDGAWVGESYPHNGCGLLRPSDGLESRNKGAALPLRRRRQCAYADVFKPTRSQVC